MIYDPWHLQIQPQQTSHGHSFLHGAQALRGSAVRVCVLWFPFAYGLLVFAETLHRLRCMTPSRNAVRLLLRFRSAIGINRNIAPTTERCFSCSTPSPVSLPGTKQAYKPFLQQNATRSFASSTDQAERKQLQLLTLYKALLTDAMC